jgi:polyisoprenoid-binding protein YceI
MRKLIFIVLFFALYSLQAQQVYTFTEGTTCVVDGTSNLRDWSAAAGEVSGKMELDKTFTKKGLPKVGATIEKARFSVVVKSLDGGRGTTMNDKIYNAFNDTENPDIVFELTKAEVTEVDKEKQRFSLNISGNLSMAGTTKSVTLPGIGKLVDDKAYSIQGEKKIDMTTYGIEPPSAMFGQIVVGKDVVVKFTLMAKPE